MKNDPTWLAYARTQIGVSEIPGPTNNPTIMGWIKKLGTKILGIDVKDDETPWCGTFAAQCFNEVGIKPPSISVRASSWDKFGTKVAPSIGAVLRFQRPGGGHVGFYVGETKTHFYVLGGNQGNKVSIVAIEKSRLVECRWPTGVKHDTVAVMGIQKAPVTKNEA